MLHRAAADAASKRAREGKKFRAAMVGNSSRNEGEESSRWSCDELPPEMTTMDAEGEGKNKSPEECKGMVRSGGGGVCQWPDTAKRLKHNGRMQARSTRIVVR